MQAAEAKVFAQSLRDCMFSSNIITFSGSQTHWQWNRILGNARIGSSMTNNGGVCTIAAGCMKLEDGFQQFWLSEALLVWSCIEM